MTAAGIAVAVMLLGAGAEAKAKALMIGVHQTSTIAPARVTLTASVAPGADPPIAYDWTTLDVAPRCRTSRCTIRFETASCRYVELQATTMLGETLTATRSVCVGDAKGMPPSAAFSLANDGPSMMATAAVSPRTDPVVVVHRWIDDTEADGDLISIPNDGACHALDLLAADSMGRVSLDRRRVCTSPSSPVLWLGASPDIFAADGTMMKVCAEASDPLGGMLQWEKGGVPLNGCGASIEPPRAVTRQTFRARRGMEKDSVASVIIAAVPATGPRSLMFARLDGAPFTVTAPRTLDIVLEVFGGVAPYKATASLSLLGSDQAVDGTASVDATGRGNARIDKFPESGAHELDVVVTDARGLEAHATAKVDVTAGMMNGTDGGMGTPTTPNAAHGCGGTLILRPRASSGWPIVEVVLILGALAFCRRRGRA